MSIARSKNLERRFNVISHEIKSELNKVFGSSLWESLGFICFDQLEDKDKIAKANFYYGQLELIEDLRKYI